MYAAVAEVTVTSDRERTTNNNDEPIRIYRYDAVKTIIKPVNEGTEKIQNIQLIPMRSRIVPWSYTMYVLKLFRTFLSE